MLERDYPLNCPVVRPRSFFSSKVIKKRNSVFFVSTNHYYMNKLFVMGTVQNFSSNNLAPDLSRPGREILIKRDFSVWVRG